MTDTTEPGRPAVGFIGLGDQGAPIAQASADAGHPLHVWARRPESLAVLEGRPFTSYEAMNEMAAAVDVLALCVREDSDVFALVERLHRSRSGARC
ncbi:hypothetical protein GCM10023194_30420 [Planotetraspora phitsanulokensis]|uniref:6-phosphogluconate dehydrogenase NADP-binding domain-containing protein n=1 Tax=Planotetraspora phitsanulokensis TaxID=575192 RepID=A0A8J3UB40_9ACTN|nr:NAD(P)-binding domain-containing protein [Planotetraspora phitsanulokensis]GII35820.1 hypothetical protein Pph01_08230 [Planotetraspora phitsanulokensis]